MTRIIHALNHGSIAFTLPLDCALVLFFAFCAVIAPPSLMALGLAAAGIWLVVLAKMLAGKAAQERGE